jgi:hypothetical protein
MELCYRTQPQIQKATPRTSGFGPSFVAFGLTSCPEQRKMTINGRALMRLPAHAERSRIREGSKYSFSAMFAGLLASKKTRKVPNSVTYFLTYMMGRTKSTANILPEHYWHAIVFVPPVAGGCHYLLSVQTSSIELWTLWGIQQD